MKSIVDEVALGLTCHLIETTGQHPKFAAKQAAEHARKAGFHVDVKEIESQIRAELHRRKKLGFGGVTHWVLRGRGVACGASLARDADTTMQRHIVTCRRCRRCIAKWERERKGKRTA
jgi:hypothetical protein